MVLDPLGQENSQLLNWEVWGKWAEFGAVIGAPQL